VALRLRRPVPLHPLLFAAVPVLVLYAGNVRQGVSVRDVLGPLGLIVGVTVGVFAVLWLAFRGNGWKAALVTSLLVVLFFAFGPTVGGLGHQAVVVAVWTALGAAGIGAVIRAREGGAAGLTRALNFVAVGLVVINVGSIVLTKARTHGGVVTNDVLAVGSTGGAKARGPHRDVYFIVLDDYGGERAMKDILGYDNEPFLDQLRRRGFYVPAHATTNYPHTADAIGSALNLDYVQRLVRNPPSDDWSPVYAILKNDAVPRFLKSRGYAYIHMGSWWSPTASNPQADVNVKLKGAHSEFTSALIIQTVPNQDAAGPLSFSAREYARVRFQFRELARSNQLRGPKFVFAHIHTPHRPFVFGARGNYVDPTERSEHPDSYNYVNQLRYANSRILQLVDTLLHRPEARRPIIVVQSDEGFYTGLNEGEDATQEELEQHFGILNAYYFPGLRRTGLYPTITPVNTFRLLFNDYFGARFPLLPDRNYATRDRAHLYDFIDVTARVRPLS
jgi:hypothetical protein